MRWFVSEMLHYPWAWRTVIFQALLDRDKFGEYRWRNAKNPLGLLRTISRRIAKKEDPGLIYGKATEYVTQRNGVPVSSLFTAACGKSGTYRDIEDESTSGGHWHDEFIDQATLEHGDDYDSPAVWEEMDAALFSSDEQLTGLVWDWQKIGERLGFNNEQIEILKLRARGIPRSDMTYFLRWDQTRIERVWKSVYREFNKPGMKERVSALLSKDR